MDNEVHPPWLANVGHGVFAMNYNQQQSDIRFKFALRKADRAEAIRRWHEKLRGIDLNEEVGLFERIADVVSPLYEYLGRAQNPRSLGMRAWCLLYAVRPELIDYETIQAAADKFGVTQEALCYQLKQLEAAFPGFTYQRRSLPPPDVLKERMRKASAGSLARFSKRNVEAA